MKVLSSQEQSGLLNSVKEKLGLRNSMMLRVFLFTGVRVSELCGLKIDDVFFGGKVKAYLTVSSAIAKLGAAREVPLNDKLRNDLQAYYQDKIYSGHTESVLPGCPLFTQHKNTVAPLTPRQVQRVVKMAGESIGIPDLHPHALRHTFATALMRITDMRTVQSLLGHKSLQSTQIYTHPSSDDMTKAVNGL
jgi:integrase/recombinase XerC